MPEIDTQQVRLRLTRDKEVLQDLRRKHRLVLIDTPDGKQEAFLIQFDSHTFAFRPGTVLTVGRRIADCLKSDSLVIVGAPLDGPALPVLEEVGSFDLARGETISQTECPVCRKEQNTIALLIEHLQKAHTLSRTKQRPGSAPEPLLAKPALEPEPEEPPTPSEIFESAGQDQDDESQS